MKIIFIDYRHSKIISIINISLKTPAKTGELSIYEFLDIALLF